MSSRRATIRTRWGLGATLCLLLGWASAQLPYIAPEMHQEQRRLQGETISFCIWQPNATSEFDRDVAQAVADALLLEASFHEYEPPYELEENEFFHEVLVLLTEECDALVGINLVPEGLPDWLIPSRAYFRAPFGFVTNHEDYERVGDLPDGAIIGSRLYSPADQQLTAYLNSLPEGEGWRRFPYTSSEPMLRHLREDVIEAGLLWLPQFMELVNGDPESEGLHVIASDPLPTVNRSLGFIMRQDDAYLRTLLDAAIESLIEGGIIDDLIEEHDLPGEPAPAN